MKENESLKLPDRRQLIHDLTVARRSASLSPPEAELLSELEGKEIDPDLQEIHQQPGTD